MALPTNASKRSSITDFVPESNDQLYVPKQSPAYERFLTAPHPRHDDRFFSVPNLIPYDERLNIGTPRLRPPKFISANNSIRSAKTYNPRPYFRSRRIRKGTIDRPELREKDPRGIWITLLPLLGFLSGLAIVAVLSYTGYASVSNHKYCEVFIDDFSSGFNSTIWTKQVETGGYG